MHDREPACGAKGTEWGALSKSSSVVSYRVQRTGHQHFFFPEKNQLIGLSYTCPKQNISVEAEYSFLGTSR